MLGGAAASAPWLDANAARRFFFETTPTALKGAWEWEACLARLFDLPGNGLKVAATWQVLQIPHQRLPVREFLTARI
jgi:hypothetical protein